MGKGLNAILIHEDDNVVTVTKALTKSSIAKYHRDGKTAQVEVLDDIPAFHKIAIADIDKNGDVYKYGQLIGKALNKISAGNHVHDHNIASPP